MTMASLVSGKLSAVNMGSTLQPFNEEPFPSTIFRLVVSTVVIPARAFQSLLRLDIRVPSLASQPIWMTRIKASESDVFTDYELLELGSFASILLGLVL